MPEPMAHDQGSSLRLQDDVVGRLHLVLQATNGVVILTEGSSDQAALRFIVDVTRIIAVGPKPKLLDACAKLKDLGHDGFVAVFDRDFDPLPVAGFKIRVYEGGDLEAAVLCLGVGEEILERLVPSQKLTSAGGAASVYREAREAARLVSRLRAANRETGWGLPFDDVDLARCVKPDRSFDGDKLVRALRQARLEREDGWAPEEAALVGVVNGTHVVDHFRGRDLLCVLERYLRTTDLRHRQGIDASRGSLEVMVHFAAGGVLAASEWGRELGELVGAA